MSLHHLFLLFFFFFYRSGAHRALHSFPTRRSSDLAMPLPFLRRGRGESMVRCDIYPGGRWNLYLSKRDRKSTRLNSSHLGISYAVFCLKKKKKKKQIHKLEERIMMSID